MSKAKTKRALTSPPKVPSRTLVKRGLVNPAPVDPTEVIPAKSKDAKDVLVFKPPERMSRTVAEEHLMLNRVLKQLREGATYYEIASGMGITAREAWNIIRRALEKYAPQFQENLSAVKDMELQKLDAMEALLWKEMQDRNQVLFDAEGNIVEHTPARDLVKGILEIQSARRSMLGLDAAKRMETTNTEIRRVYVGVDPNEL